MQREEEKSAKIRSVRSVSILIFVQQETKKEGDINGKKGKKNKIQ